MQASGRFYLTVVCICKTVYHHVVGQHMLVYKLQGGFRIPLFEFIKQFIIMMLRTKCLYTSFRAILVDRPL